MAKVHESGKFKKKCKERVVVVVGGGGTEMLYACTLITSYMCTCKLKETVFSHTHISIWVDKLWITCLRKVESEARYLSWQ